MDKIRVALVDDHTLFRDGLKSLLGSTDGIEIIGEYGTADALLSEVDKQVIDIVIADISMEGMNGIELTQYISTNIPCIKVIVLSMHNNREFIIRALEAGAKGYLPKDIAGQELIDAIFQVYEGREYFHPQISQTIMRGLMQKSTPEHGAARLTPREIQVLKLAADGLMNKEVAASLNISIRTVDCHKNNIMSKLGLNTIAELVKYAIRNKIIEI